MLHFPSSKTFSLNWKILGDIFCQCYTKCVRNMWLVQLVLPSYCLCCTIRSFYLSKTKRCVTVCVTISVTFSKGLIFSNFIQLSQTQNNVNTYTVLYCANTQYNNKQRLIIQNNGNLTIKVAKFYG